MFTCGSLYLYIPFIIWYHQRDCINFGASLFYFSCTLLSIFFPSGRGIAGDLYLIVHVDEKPGVWREGLHLYSKINIDFTEAILGTVVKVIIVTCVRYGTSCCQSLPFAFLVLLPLM